MNLFALELSAVLERRQMGLAMLHMLRGSEGNALVSPAKVARLQRSLADNSTAVLNERELGALAGALHLDGYEVKRLRAALLGEAVRKLLTGRMSPMSALAEGERVAGLVLQEEEEAAAVRAEISGVTSATGLLDSRPSVDTNAAVAYALEMAAESCELGELWLGLAQQCADTDQREDVLGMAYTALDRAAQCLACAPRVAQGSATQEEWRRVIEQSLVAVRQLRPSQ